MAEPLTTLLSLSKIVYDMSANIGGRSSTQRKEIAGYLDDISNTIQEIIDTHDSGFATLKPCAALGKYLQQLDSVIGHGELVTEDYEQLTYLVEFAARHPNSLTSILEDHHPAGHLQRKRVALEGLAEASGVFKAAASRMRVTPPPKWWQFWKS